MKVAELGPNLNLKTGRLLLRPLNVDDVDIMWPDISDREISRLMAWDTHADKAETVAFIENEVARRKSGRGCTWAIFAGGAFCGIVSLIGIQHRHRALTYNKAELAYWLGRKFQGHGIMTEACRAILCFAFEMLHLHKVYVSHFGENEASKRLIRRLGFRHVGRQIQEFQKDGVWHDHELYELLDSEYAAMPSAMKSPAINDLMVCTAR